MASPVALHELTSLTAAQRAALLTRAEDDLGPFLAGVEPIIARVRAEGDAALVHFAAEFDKARLTAATLRVPEAAFAAARAALEPALIDAIAYAIDAIRRFHAAQMPEEMWLKEIHPGAFAGERTRPIPSVACYMPRGKGAFPSVAMMTLVPAVVAAVPRIIVVTPPGPDGTVDAATLVAADMAGVREIYACGGAQAVAAVAYGTETVPRVAKIVGPGSPWVAAAKRVLAGVVDPGIAAGPSESIILADAAANPRIAALDLIIESEHGPDSSSFLVTDSRAVADAARAAVPDHWAAMGAERVGYSRTVLSGTSGGIVLAPDLDAALAFVNDYAPEHLQILAAEPWALIGRIEHAGEILLGEHTPGTLGNFVLGPNAVIPTAGAARVTSPLSVHDFLKRTSLGYVTEAGYPPLAKHAHTLARYEGFDGHANAVSARRDTARQTPSESD